MHNQAIIWASGGPLLKAMFVLVEFAASRVEAVSSQQRTPSHDTNITEIPNGLGRDFQIHRVPDIRETGGILGFAQDELRELKGNLDGGLGRNDPPPIGRNAALAGKYEPIYLADVFPLCKTAIHLIDLTRLKHPLSPDWQLSIMLAPVERGDKPARATNRIVATVIAKAPMIMSVHGRPQAGHAYCVRSPQPRARHRGEPAGSGIGSAEFRTHNTVSDNFATPYNCNMSSGDLP